MAIRTAPLNNGAALHQSRFTVSTIATASNDLTHSE
jgi:hypothetical protein